MPEGEGQPASEAVPTSVRVDDRTGYRSRVESAGPPVRGEVAPARLAFRPYGQTGNGGEVARSIPLGRVPTTADQCVQGDTGPGQLGQHPRGRYQHPRAAGHP